MEPINILENLSKFFSVIVTLFLNLFPSVVLFLGAVLFLFLALVFFLLTGTSL